MVPKVLAKTEYTPLHRASLFPSMSFSANTLGTTNWFRVLSTSSHSSVVLGSFKGLRMGLVFSAVQEVVALLIVALAGEVACCISLLGPGLEVGSSMVFLTLDSELGVGAGEATDRHGMVLQTAL